MTDSSSHPNPDDEILAQILRELERPDDSRSLDDYLKRYPHLASQIRELFEMRGMLDRSRPVADFEQPERLGDFRIIRLITRGGMGDVYEAEQDQPRRRVVVKVIRQGRTSPEARERFLREQEMLAKLHHTHIVPIHAAGEEGPLQYFAMPYIDGAALHHVVRTASQWESSHPGSQTPSLAQLAEQVAKDSQPAAAASTGPDASTHPEAKPGPVASAEARPGRLTLSPEYFRSVAEVMADAAEALHHAHEAQIIHRDLKPSNIMVDKDGQCWIIDFGLAGYLNGHDGAAALGGKLLVSDEPATASGIMGTPQYMAPEQFDGRADARADVWGLGVTLYELLTLRRAFDAEGIVAIGEQIRSKEPPTPRELVGNVPTDLAAICQKALRKRSGQRYQSARDLADDLRRWMFFEPVSVRRPWWRRLWLWSRRNKGWAAAILFGLVAIVAAGGNALQKAETAEARATAADAQADKARVEADAARRELELQELQRLRLSAHSDGWSIQAWERVKQLAKGRSGDANLRDQAAGTLIGLDARRIKRIDKPATSLAFDSTGKRLLIGGSQKQGARLWDQVKDETATSAQGGSGPVAFRDPETPLQVVFHPKNDRMAVMLWNVARQEEARTFKLADKEGGVIRLAALNAAGASFLAVVANLPPVKADEAPKGQIVVWETQTGKEVKKFDKRATALALSPDGKLLASGDADGEISIWSLPGGDPVATLKSGRATILSLTFGHNLIRSEPGQRKSAVHREWVLAAGDAGGAVVIWDLELKIPRANCRGSRHSIYALAFSPDGSILASAGRNPVKLWDVATGRELLSLNSPNVLQGLAFSPDGKNLAVSAIPAFDATQGVEIWELEYGRGMRTLYGLANRISKVVYSPDGRFVAALDDGWQIGIWELATGHLKHLLDVPPGVSSDNAALAFSPKGERFAFSTGSQAQLWELAAGKVTSWKLPPGLADLMAFDAKGEKLLLIRLEAPDRKDPAFDRVLRFRNLLSADPLKAFHEIPLAARRFQNAALSHDAAYLVLGLSGADQKDPKSVMVIDGPTGKPVWPEDIKVRPNFLGFEIDPTSKILAFPTDNDGTFTLVDIATKKHIDTIRTYGGVHGPGAQLRAAVVKNDQLGLIRRSDNAILVHFGPAPSAPHAVRFSLADQFLAVGNEDGTITIIQIREVQRRLTSVDPGW